MARDKELWSQTEPDRQSREKLVAMLIAGGAATVSAGEARILELLKRTGVFLVGGNTDKGVERDISQARQFSMC